MTTTTTTQTMKKKVNDKSSIKTMDEIMHDIMKNEEDVYAKDGNSTYRRMDSFVSWKRVSEAMKKAGYDKTPKQCRARIYIESFYDNTEEPWTSPDDDELLWVVEECNFNPKTFHAIGRRSFPDRSLYSLTRRIKKMEFDKLSGREAWRRIRSTASKKKMKREEQEEEDKLFYDDLEKWCDAAYEIEKDSF